MGTRRRSSATYSFRSLPIIQTTIILNLLHIRHTDPDPKESNIIICTTKAEGAMHIVRQRCSLLRDTSSACINRCQCHL